MNPSPQHSTSGKASFHHIYNHVDPRPYYQVLRPLDYRIPEYALPIFERCARALQRLRGKRRLTVVDLCCGYGVNAALLKHDVAMDDLYDRYESDEAVEMTTTELIDADRRYFSRRRRASPVGEVVGIDPADRAVGYSEAVGLLDAGAALDLEEQSPDEQLRARFAKADMITITGGTGYITGTTFEKVLEPIPEDRRPWIACFPLRIAPFHPFVQTFAEHGLKTEQVREYTYPQRRFVSEEERERAASKLAELGIDSRNPERDGYLHAEFHLARPTADIARVPIGRLTVPPERRRATRDHAPAHELELDIRP